MLWLVSLWDDRKVLLDQPFKTYLSSRFPVLLADRSDQVSCYESFIGGTRRRHSSATLATELTERRISDSLVLHPFTAIGAVWTSGAHTDVILYLV